MDTGRVEEIQGLYGPFSLTEKVLQRIWERGEFHQENLTTLSGKSLRILEPGRWNAHEGPDFKEARLVLNGREIVGDVEVHFHAGDWEAHGHGANQNFRNVILHVLLHESLEEVRVDESVLESIALMPLLERDLEDYVMEYALLELERVDSRDKFDWLRELPLEKREALLGDFAERRWEQKVGFARRRLDESGWQDTCHQSALEVLGYARNRSAMNRVASRYSIADFSGNLEPDAIYEEFSDYWKLKGMRPVNHPRVRLRQYSEICRARPDWPEQLLTLLQKLPAMKPAMETKAFRRLNNTKAIREAVSSDVFSGVLAEKRLNTLLCDALLPLVSAAGIVTEKDYWLNWYPGDMPASLVRSAGELKHPTMPLSNGFLQGMLLALITSQRV